MSAAQQVGEVDTHEYREQKLPKRVFQSRILGKGRHELDLSSRTIHTDHIRYSIRGRVSQLGIFEVLMTGTGKQQMGYHEPVGCEKGDLVLVNLRDASNWITIDGNDYCLFNWDEVIGRLVKSDKPTIDKLTDCSLCKQRGMLCPICSYAESYNAKQPEYEIEMFQNYLLLEHDPEQFRQLVLQNGSTLQIDGIAATDGLKSDDEDRNRFPYLYSRLVDKGPGKTYPKLRADWGNAIELVEESCPADRGMMVGYISTRAIVRFRYYGRDMLVLHARNADMELDPPCPAPSAS